MSAISPSSVEVASSKYEFSHGRKPRGSGHWAFQIGKAVEFIPGHQSYGAAKKAAQGIAAERGHRFIEVAP